MIRTLELVLSPSEAADAGAHRRAAAAELGVPGESLRAVRLRKRSIDARRGRVVYRVTVEVWIDEDASDEALPTPDYPTVKSDRRVIVIGAGPAGLFAALRLIELGVQPVVLERGADVRARRRDLVAIQREGTVNPESNYCFGEGGAGTYSDGKLYTRASKRGDVNAILRTLVAHGSPADILIDAHPHIGTNKLPKVVEAIRESILRAGGDIRFNCRVDDFVLDSSGATRGVLLANGDELTGEAIILATGHSARDMFRLLKRRGIHIEAKPFAMGVRVEHPQPLIDQIQYRSATRDPFLPAASYRLAAESEGRGVFSFCMCPGGFIVPAATAPDEIVVNGMSPSKRNSPFANSGIVVAVELEDLAAFSKFGALAGMEYQRSVEVACARAGGGAQKAPAQRLTDFLRGSISSTLPQSSYGPGLTSAPMIEVLPPALGHRLKEGLAQFGKSMKGYLTEEAVVVGVESRTSAPVRVPRDPVTLEHVKTRRLFPCGEGAGYAGGIVSAAMDGVRVAEAALNR